MTTTAVVGGGVMAHAIVSGAVDAGVAAPGEWIVADPDPERRRLFGSLGIETVEHAGELAGRLAPGDAVLLAVKPQKLGAAAADLAAVDMGGRPVVSILAGARSGTIRGALGGGARVVRAMPNTPARLRLGATAIALGAGAGEGDEALPLRLFGALGETFLLPEDLMDAFTAVAGSGPAYLFYLAEAMGRAASELGLDEADAARMVAQTVLGAAHLLSEDPASAGELRRRVTSPGGTTAAAIERLDASGVSDRVVRAIRAARDRGRELAEGG
jgi:pyrroline-5-carboxylate reductase